MALVAAYWLLGVQAFLLHFFTGLKSQTSFPAESTYISGIGAGNLPAQPVTSDRPSLDIVSWAKKNILPVGGEIFHSTSNRLNFTGINWDVHAHLL